MKYVSSLHLQLHTDIGPRWLGLFVKDGMNKFDMVILDGPNSLVENVHITSEKESVISTLETAVSPDFSCNFFDVTLVFSNGSVQYYR